MHGFVLFLLLACKAPIPKEPMPDRCAPGYFGIFLGVDGDAVKVEGLVDGGPAQRAGLKEGDTLVKIDYREVNGTESLRELIASLRPGARVPLAVRRNGAEVSLSIRVGTKP